MSGKGFRNLLKHIFRLDDGRKEQLFWQLKNELFPNLPTEEVIRPNRI